MSVDRRFGENHPRAKLTNQEVELMRKLYEEGGRGYGTLAQAFEVDKGTVRDIVTYRRRARG